MTELTPEQAKLLGADLVSLREKYQTLNPKLTLAGWIEQLGSHGYRYLRAEGGEANLPLFSEPEKSYLQADYDALFENGQLKEPTTLRAKIIQCLFIGCVVDNFALACTAADTILKHIREQP